MGRFKKVLPSKAYEVWEKSVRASFPIHNPINCPIHVNAQIYYKGHRPDLSGALESIGDCLQGIVWADDAQIESWDGSRRYHDLKNPRTEITVRWETVKYEQIGRRNNLIDKE